MSIRKWVFGLALSCAPIANAGVSTLFLAPQDHGPYTSGQIIPVDIFFDNAEGQDTQLRQLTLDFSATDPALGLPETFEFDTSTLIVDALYSIFPDMPVVDIVYTSSSPQPGFIIEVPVGGSHLVGTIQVIYPREPGTYTLDAINASAPDTNTGAFFAYGFESRTNLHATLGNLGGGAVDIRVPEPGTLALLGVGGLFPLRRRPSTKHPR